ncbi:MAG: hypothetical protein BWY27_00890 [Bacteroidetes bacterium ADurb.Bin234]|nr:MAG: hypothetical protein BWY27_00890 [Bacteroidetes bacterium ADurb.Bin234]
MKTIKLFYTILITFLCNTHPVQAQQIYIPPDSNWISPMHTSCMGKIVSTEHEQLVSYFTVDIVCYFIDTTSIDSMLWKLPEGWSITLSNDSIMPVYIMNDSLVLSFTVSIPDTGNLPFYPQYVELKLLSNKQDSNFQVVTIAGKVYFTPYNSIEIWSLEDFYNLKRYWLEEDTIDRQRIYIPRDSIPLSDLTDPSLYERDSATWDHWWIDNFREIEVEGLAYTILMSPVPFDSLEYYYDIYDIDNIDTSAPMQKSGNIFTGIISGRLTANIENDLKSYASISEIGLAGLRVCLLDKDGLFYENYGETYTDEDGYFQIPYVKTQTVLEGEKVELYIRVFSETNSSYTVQSRNFWGVYKSDFYVGKCDQGAGAITKNIKITTDKADGFRATHWVRKGIKYFYDQNVSCMSGGLKIKINCLGSYANVYTGQPTLHIETGDGGHENTVYHEFGHYTMYRLQKNNMLIPYGRNGVNLHSWTSENTGLLAWIEGWASAMQMILDAAHWQEDNEYGLDEAKYSFENLEIFSNINNGFRSEYHIALAIYDLWDGPNKGLPGRIPYFNIHGWNDSEIETKLPYSYYSWKSNDDIELTFAQICAPLQTITIYSDLDSLRNIGHYYRKLISQFSDCELISDINRTFRENRVLWNISEYEKGWNLGNLHLDYSFQNVTVNENGYFYQAEIDGYPINLLWYNWDDIYSINSLNEDNINKNIIINNTSISPCILKDNYWLGIYEENVVDRSTNLILSGEFHTCGENEIIAKNGDVEIKDGSLTVNKNSLLQINLHGELNINNASLRIASGGTLYLKNGSYTILSNHSSIIIEEGGYICVEDGAIINLYDANSKIELLGGALHGLNPILEISSTQCQSVCDYPTDGDGVVICKCIPYTLETLIISSNCSYIGSNHIILNELIIENNATATFTNSTLYFYKNAIVTILPGGKLIIDGGTLTNACNGELWQGIFVEGDPFDSTQSESLQGMVELKNGATIENAVCAINVGLRRLGANSQMCVLGGGIVKASNASFINNLKAVEFGPYHRHTIVRTVPLTRNASSFTDCNFTVNNNA